MEKNVEIPITINDFCEQYKWPTPGSLRKMCTERSKNGLHEAFVEAGGRRLVLPLTLFRLLKEGKKECLPKGRKKI